MSFISSAFKSLRTFYGEINSATLTGAIDVVVVEQEDGSFQSSPFHVRFGKLGVLKAREKIVDIEINGEPVNIHMKLDDAGTAFFVEELNEEDEEGFPSYLATSPLPDPEDGHLNLKTEERPKPDTNVIADNDASKVRNKVKKKRKLRKGRHSRSGSKSSLRDVIFEMDDVDGDVEDDSDAGSVDTADKEVEELCRDPAPPSSNTDGENALSKSPTNSINAAEIDNSLLGSRIPRSLSPEKNELETSNVDEDIRPIREDFHYFSDQDNQVSKPSKRSRSPVLSDSEYEVTKSRSGVEDDNAASWKWGELPSPSSTSTGSGRTAEEKKQMNKVTTSSSTARKWSIFNYLGSNNKRQPEGHRGVYLEDIHDEEMMALYVGSTQRPPYGSPAEDAESGNGPSLPVSPHSVEGAIGGTCQHDDFMPPLINISLCGVLSEADGRKTCSPLLFEQHAISFDDFVVKLEIKSDIFDDSNLVVRIDGDYYTWKDARPAVMSWILYRRPIPRNLIPDKSLDVQKEACRVIPEEKEDEEEKSEEVAPTVEEIKEEDIPVQEEANRDAEEANRDTEETKKDAEEAKKDAAIHEEVSGKKSWWSWYSRSKTEITEPSSELTGLEKGPMKTRISNVSGNSSDSSNSYEKRKIVNSPDEMIKGGERYKKTLRLSSNDVKCLNLRFGSNEAEFTVTTPYQGTSWCKCHIYLWKSSDKLVISDIDGTITKSDVLGHIFPIIGRDWAQSGVASLFNKIRRNGYHIVYLSARAIGQAAITKDYLQSIKQGDICLPDGPLLLNPTSLISAFHREVIEKKPEEFKISCLRDIQKLYNDGKNPFYAGYGNRINDAYAYRMVGIPITRIFTINYLGELKHELTQTFQTSYTNQSSIVDHLFPPRNDEPDNVSATNDYNSFVYWRDPIGDFVEDALISLS